MQHEKGFPCFSWFPRVRWEGFGKAKNEASKGIWVFLLVPKSGVGRAWEVSKWKHEKGLGASWFPSVGWEWFGKVKNEA